MITNPVSIEITRIEHKLSLVKAIMPTWTKAGDDGYFYATIPFLGLETYGTSEDDLQVAVEEAFNCFCIAAEKFGLGIESELEYLGWEQVEGASEDHSLMEVKPVNRIFDNLVNTGDTRLLSARLDEQNLVAA